MIVFKEAKDKQIFFCTVFQKFIWPIFLYELKTIMALFFVVKIIFINFQQ